MPRHNKDWTREEHFRFSRRLDTAAEANNETIRWLTGFDGARLLLPKQFAPGTEFLKRHAEKCLNEQNLST